MLSHCSKVAIFRMMWTDAFTCLLQFLGVTNTHPDQLTLAEFSAIRTRRLVQNLDMMAVARIVELAKQDKDANAQDEVDCPEQKLSREGVSFDDMGGEHDIDEEAHDISEEDVLYTSPLRPARMTLSEVMGVLRRDDEVAAAKKRGCHRESDMQMKAFLAKY